MRTYQEFLEGKMLRAPESGFDPGDDVSDVLFPFQRDIVRWALRGGRRAIFAAFGLGKSLMQLELMRLVGNREGGRQLIVCPLGVRQEFRRDAAMLGLEPAFVRRTEEVGGDGLYLTNYESVRDGRLDVNLFNATTLVRLEDLPDVPRQVPRRALPIRRDRDAVAEPTQGAHPLRGIPRRDGHGAGFDAILQKGQHEGEQPHAVPAQGA